MALKCGFLLGNSPPPPCPTLPVAVPHLGLLYFLLRQAAAIQAEAPGPARRPVRPGQAAILRVAKGLGAIHVAPELGTDVLSRGVGAVAEAQPKDLLALLVQLVEGPAAWEACGQRQGRGRGVQETVSCGGSREIGRRGPPPITLEDSLTSAYKLSALSHPQKLLRVLTISSKFLF